MSEARPYYAPGSLSAAFYDVVTAADASLAGQMEVYARLLPPGGRILELGCGSGRLPALLAARGFQVTGLTSPSRCWSRRGGGWPSFPRPSPGASSSSRAT